MLVVDRNEVAKATVLNIAAYRFVAINDPDALIEQLRQTCERLSIKGSILVASEGINLFLAGASEAIHDLLAMLEADSRFAELDVKFSWSDTPPFRRLRIKHKREIIRFDQPQIDPSHARAPAVTPQQLRDWLRVGHDESGRRIVLLDTRNAQEIAYGTFTGAVTLPISSFTELPQALEAQRAALANTKIVSFCTGGIRCEKAALWMHQAGYDNVCQLEGGILGYFEKVGGEGYSGGCFVFDERVALAPDLQPMKS